MNPVALDAWAVTDAGRRRKVNEDSYLCEFPLFLVADGLGGYDAGDVASAAAIASFAPLCGRADLDPDEVVTQVRAAHDAVASVSAGTEHGAACTLTGVAVVRRPDGPHWLLVNIGDSRVYRLLGGRLEQVTHDHSEVQELVDAGQLGRDEMATYAGRNVITRALGADGSVPDYWLMPVIAGERLLACSDGLYTEVSEDRLAEHLAAGAPPGVTARRLLAAALDAGGRDNVTVLVVDVVAGGADPSVLGPEWSAGVDEPDVMDELDEDTVVPEGRARRRPGRAEGGGDE